MDGPLPDDDAWVKTCKLMIPLWRSGLYVRGHIGIYIKAIYR